MLFVIYLHNTHCTLSCYRTEK